MDPCIVPDIADDLAAVVDPVDLRREDAGSGVVDRRESAATIEEAMYAGRIVEPSHNLAFTVDPSGLAHD
jgi:hypothetical protein